MSRIKELLNSFLVFYVSKHTYHSLKARCGAVILARCTARLIEVR